MDNDLKGRREMTTISFTETWHETREWARFEWIAGNKTPQPILRVILFLSVVKAWAMSKTLCRWRGHKWEASLFANAEFAQEDFTCTRCNRQHHITYY